MSQVVDPRLKKRKKALLDAARELFLEQGFERTTLAEVVERGGGSLATLYKLFGNKQGLIAAVIDDFRDQGGDIVRAVADQNLPPKETLLRITHDMMAVSLGEEHLSIVRILLAQTMADPDFAADFFKTTETGKREACQALFCRWHEEGIAMSAPPRLLADIFFGMILLDFQVQAISHGHIPPPTREEIEIRTDFFLRGAGMLDG